MTQRWTAWLSGLVSFILGVGLLWRRYPSIYKTDAMWAEGGSLYFLKANQSSFFDNITALDYGYVPLWCRLWAFAVSKVGISEINTVTAYNWLALFVASSCCAVFALPYFRAFIKSDMSRLLICLGLLCGPDYETKNFINVPYYTSIPCFLALILAAQTITFSMSAGFLGGLSIAICMLSKPHFLAFTPFLVILLAISLWKRSASLALLVMQPLVAALIQASVLYSNRPQPPPPGASAVAQGILWLKWSSYAMAYQLFGRSISRPNGLRLIMAVALASWLGYQLFTRRRELSKLAWPAVCGLSLLLSGLMLGIVSLPDLYRQTQMPWVSAFLQHRHMFIPMMGCYFLLALIVAHLAQGFMRQAVLCLWLCLGWPFGLLPAAAEPLWPMTGYSAWAPLTAKIYDHKKTTGRHGCIPLNPYPWVLGLDCEMLLGISDIAAVTQKRSVALRPHYEAPQSAKVWLVDTIGLRLLNNDRGTQALTAYDKSGRVIGESRALVSKDSVLTFFYFDPPLAGTAAVSIEDSAMQPSSVVMDESDTQPLWVWLGKHSG